MNKSIHIGDDFKKKRKVRRNKSGLIIHTPIKGMKNTEFSDLLNHNKAYTQLLLTYVKTPIALGLEETNWLESPPLYDDMKRHDYRLRYKPFAYLSRKAML